MIHFLVCRPEQAPRSSGNLLVVCFLLLTLSGAPAAADQSSQSKDSANPTAESATHPFAQQEHLPGDYNHDGQVDDEDLQQWQEDFSSTSDSDADQGGDSDGFDFLSWQRFYGRGSDNSVPEPCTVSLLLIPTLYQLGFRRMR